MSAACPKTRVLVVSNEDQSREHASIFERMGWSVTRIGSIGGALKHIRESANVDLVALCPDSEIDRFAELSRRIKFDDRTGLTHVAAMLKPEFHDSRGRFFDAGVDECIRLPAPDEEVMTRLSNSVRAKRATDTLEDATTVITALANAIEGKDAYTRGHVERVSTYAVEIGRRAGLDDDALTTLRTGALVHDVGKVAVPDHVLNKPGRLTDDEMDIMKRHPVVGCDILEPLRSFKNVLPIVRWHHERPNGTGYPDGVGGDELSLLPRIMSVADCFDALSTDRPYRKGLALEKCREILCLAGEKGELDAELVNLFLGTIGLEAPVSVPSDDSLVTHDASAVFMLERT